jgi:hypothetical protein
MILLELMIRNVKYMDFAFIFYLYHVTGVQCSVDVIRKLMWIQGTYNVTNETESTSLLAVLSSNNLCNSTPVYLLTYATAIELVTQNNISLSS